MNRWFVLVFVLAVLLVVSLFASCLEIVSAGQVVAVSASIVVAVVGLFALFGKPKT